MLDWTETVFELIDMRSFSNLWYWIALAVVWSSASHYVLGVPFDLILRARRKGGEAEADLHDMVRINVNRFLYIADTAGLWLIALGSFLLTGLCILGFGYAVEFAQATFLLALPLSLVLVMSIRTARVIKATDGADLYKRLAGHRLRTQIVGMLSILVTAMWGMWQNMTVGPI